MVQEDVHRTQVEQKDVGQGEALVEKVPVSAEPSEAGSEEGVVPVTQPPEARMIPRRKVMTSELRHSRLDRQSAELRKPAPCSRNSVAANQRPVFRT